MYFPPLIDTKCVAFRHREDVINSYENERSYNDLPCVGTAAWRTWRPFTRIGRAKRVGRHVLQATVLLTEDIHVAASNNAMLCKNFQHNSKVFQIFVFSVQAIKDICLNTYFWTGSVNRYRKGRMSERSPSLFCTPVGNRTQIVGTGIRNSIH